MEKTPLNKAHEAGRRAAKLIRKGLFEEAAECHLEAAALLHDLQLRLSDDNGVLRSLDEQAKYHKRQAELVHIRRKALEKYKARIKTMEAQRANAAATGAGASSSAAASARRSGQQHSTNQQQEGPRHEILKTFDEADSLLQILSERKFNPPAKENKVSIPDTVSYHTKPVFTIRPKNDADVIEELQMVNSNLRNLVDKLLGELQEVREENRELKARLDIYEPQDSTLFLSDYEKERYAALNKYKPRELPELAPLDSPEFDFGDFA